MEFKWHNAAATSRDLIFGIDESTADRAGTPSLCIYIKERTSGKKLGIRITEPLNVETLTSAIESLNGALQAGITAE
jgi:hypothetical protein